VLRETKKYRIDQADCCALVSAEKGTASMSFLDQPGVDWTRPESTELRDLFVLAYPWRDSAVDLANSAGIAPGTFPIHDNMRTTWTKLMEVMARQGKLRTMVEKAAEDPTIVGYQVRFQNMLTDKPAVSTIQARPDDDWWKGRDKDPRVASKLHLQRLIMNRRRFLNIEVARQVAQVAQSVAKLNLSFQTEEAYGTGFLIQKDLLLTNHHNVTHKDYGDIKAMTVEFDYEHDFVGQPLVLQARVDSIVKNETHDWAVVALERSVDRAPIALGTPWHIANDDSVIIIQHPLGAFKQFAVEMMAVQYADDNIVQYLADTQDGSSGSPVFNRSMHPIALHHAEAEVEVTIDNRKETVWRNEGIRMDKVMEGLQSYGIAFTSN
jgi:V8-like Glu-specific endopeptidase